MEEANKLIGTGKRHLVMGDAVAAVNVLQEACGMLAKTYGDTADECGEAFFLCGKALLELARMENSVLGNALEGVPEEDEKEEKPKDSNIESTDGVDENTRDELRAQVYDAMEEKKKDVENAGDGVKSSEKKEGEKEEGEKKEKAAGDKEKSAGKEGDGKKEVANGHVNETVSADGEKEEKGKKEENGEKKEENGENGAKVEESSEHLEKGEEEEEMEEEGGEGEEEEDEGQEGETTAEKDSDDEEVGNLQLAWEMLEVAKVIYKRKEGEADQLLAAQAHLKLGEVASESGNYPQAVEDFQECLTLQLKHLPSDSRLLAETHCQLGLTLTLTCQYSQAIEQFNSSMAVINSRLAKLQKAIDDAAGPEAVAEETKEMEELKALLPDIKEKVEDAAEGLKTASAAAEAMKEVLTGESPFPAPSTQNGSTAATTIPVKSASGKAAAASDISHLVRKKRKPEESPVKENDSKKVKQAAHVDGSATNGV